MGTINNLVEVGFHSERNKEAEQHLWISVLAKAMEDAFQSSEWGESRKAIDWIKDNRSDFKEVCRMAGRSPEYVREKILQSLLEREKQIVNNTATIQENTSNISVCNLPRYMHSYLDRKKDDK